MSLLVSLSFWCSFNSFKTNSILFSLSLTISVSYTHLGPREVCNQLSSRGLTCSSFVADMSYGFSCNIGKKIPRDWCYEQYKEISNYNGHGFDLDKDMYSEAIPATNQFHSGSYNYDSGKNEETYLSLIHIFSCISHFTILFLLFYII